MKLIDLALILVVILLPLTLVNLINTNAKIKGQNMENLYSNVIDSALMDASQAMKEVESTEKDETDYGYNSLDNRKVNINAQYGIDTFLKTLYNELNITGDVSAQEILKRYIPVVSVISYDGVYIYSMEKYDSDTKISHVLKPKVYYTGEIGNYIISYTLSDYVTIIRKTTGEQFRGYLTDTTFTASLNANSIDNATIDSIRKLRSQTIIDKIAQQVTYAINKHNTYAQQNGILYNFKMPSISNAEWLNTIQDVGMLAFVQGVATGNKYLNHHALGVSNISEDVKYYLTRGTKGNLYHRDSKCTWIDAANTIINDSSINGKDFARSRLEAAQAGYSPCPICNP